MRSKPFSAVQCSFVVRTIALGSVALLFLIQLGGGFLRAPAAQAQTNAVVDHRIIVGAASTQGYCFDWQDTGNGYGPGCWHQDEGSQWDAIDVSGGGIQAGTNVWHQEYGVQGSVALWVTAINPCGQFDTGTNCGGGYGCSYVYVQMRDVSSGATIGEEHYLHVVPQASLGYMGQASSGWSFVTVGIIASSQPMGSCIWDGAHLHQSGRTVYPDQVTNRNVGVGAGDDPSGCGGAISRFLCLSPLGDPTYHWLHAIEEGTPTSRPAG